MEHLSELLCSDRNAPSKAEISKINAFIDLLSVNYGTVTALEVSGSTTDGIIYELCELIQAIST